MKHIKLVVLLVAIWGMAYQLQAQRIEQEQVLWGEVKTGEIQVRSSRQQTLPEKYRVFQVDLEKLRQILQAAPERFSADAQRRNVKLELPMPDGTIQGFSIVKAQVLHPDLAARYPGINSYAGEGLDDLTATVRFDLTPNTGFHAQILSGRHGAVHIDPISQHDSTFYIVYFKKELPKRSGFNCATGGLSDTKNSIGSERTPADCRLRIYSIALASTLSYSNYHSAPDGIPTVAKVLAAMNTSMTRVNGIYERDMAVSLQIVPNNDDLIILDADLNRFRLIDGNLSDMVEENHNFCTDVLTSAGFDIGHVLSADGNAGLAALSSVCDNSRKGRGATVLSPPEMDRFDVDYLSHEIGHQFGASHTQNNNCNREAETAVEPGSGSTIMGYAGICPDNVQNFSDDYFHAISLQQMADFVTGISPTGVAGCGTVINTGNTSPVVSSVATSPVTIPASTPFELWAQGGGSASLSYTWEQMDNEIATMPPESTNTGGPMFRSLSPSDSRVRYFPNLETILDGDISNEWEVLPSADRAMNFRVTARDNFSLGGCTANSDFRVVVDGSTGPFKVTSPDIDACLESGTVQTITWDVAGSDAGNVNCANVDILLSVDGGQTFSYTLATGVLNNGVHDVMLPSMLRTLEGRIKIACSDNIFFDINDEDIVIECPELLVVSESPAEGIYRAGDIIRTSGEVVVRTNTQFLAGTTVLLGAGFRTEMNPNQSFLARIQPCDPCAITTGGSFLIADDQNIHIKFIGPAVESILDDVLMSRAEALHLYPNPASTRLHLAYTLEQGGEVSLHFANQYGQVVRTEEQAFQERGEHVREIQLNGWPAGLYYAVLRTASGRQVKAFVVAGH